MNNKSPCIVFYHIILQSPVRKHFQVSRSTALLRSLGNERQRWESTSLAFQTQMGTIAGDVLLCSAFLAYGGNFAKYIASSDCCVWIAVQSPDVEELSKPVFTHEF